MLYYCDKCGRIVMNHFNKIQHCDCCNTLTKPIPQKYLLNDYGLSMKNEESKDLLREELVKTSTNFDKYLFEHRDEILEQKHNEFNAKLEIGKAYRENKNNMPKCITCGSTNIKRISTGNRLISVGLFGLASGKIAKTMECRSCGYKW